MRNKIERRNFLLRFTRLLLLLLFMILIIIVIIVVIIINRHSFVQVGDLREPLTDEQITSGRTWDVQLALALLDATAGTSLAGVYESHFDNM